MKYFMMLLALLFVPAASANPFTVDLTGTDASYAVIAADVTPAATATDVMTICGSATKTIYLNHIQVTADATSPSVLDFYVYKRTAANTGGASTSPSITKYDSHDPNPTAAIKLYSTNPTGLGTGTLMVGDHYALPAAATTGYPGIPWTEDFGTRGDKNIVLYGTSECVAFGLNGQTIPAGTILYIEFAWKEK